MPSAICLHIAVALQLLFVARLEHVSACVGVRAIREILVVDVPKIAAVLHCRVEASHVVVNLERCKLIHEKAGGEVPLVPTKVNPVQQTILRSALRDLPFVCLVTIIMAAGEHFLCDPINFYIHNGTDVSL